ncbi:VgrG-related protein [Nonomuraea sp. NPDC047897]|uniref:VgrG-related protein n=1 Tax=Nonomuraea sp. NPDC047897 TaxID=3364346 RepID=UPI00371F3E4B
MPAELFTSGLLVEVAGSPLPPDVAALLASGWVESNANLLDMFLLRFRDDHNVVLEHGRLGIGAKVRLSVMTSAPGGPEPLMCGEVISVGLDADLDGTFTEVRGLDEAHRLLRGRRVVTYPDMSVADIVRKVAVRAGLRVGRIDPPPGPRGRPGAQINQDGVSDWDFLSRLARRTGAHVSVTDGTLSFRLPEAPGTPEPGRALALGDALLALRATVTAQAQTPALEVRGWDADGKQPITATATPGAVESAVPGADPVALGECFTAPAFLSGDSRHRTQADADAAARTLAADLGGAAAELEGLVRGDPLLRAGAVVTLAEVGEPFAGTYTLSSARHEFSATGGYTTAITVSARQDRSLYALGNGPQPPAGAGLVPAVVSDVRDPDGKGRVRLSMPWLSADFTSGWARVAQPGAGAGRGALMPPEVGDEVLVGFENGDFDHPYVLGGLFNGQDAPPSLAVPLIDDLSGQANARALVSRNGHRLELLDAATGAGGVLIATGDGRLTVRLDDKAGTIAISGAAGVVVDAGSGPLTLKSAGRLTLKSAAGVKVDAGAGPLELDGARVAVTGQADVVVRGTQVRIN